MREPSPAQRQRLRGRGRHDAPRSLPRDLGDYPLPDDGTLNKAPERVNKPVRFEWYKLLVQNLLKATILAIFPSTIALGATITVWVGASAVPVRTASSATHGAQDAFFETLEHSQPVLTELSILGAPVGEVEKVYFAFVDSDAAEKPHTADVLLSVLDGQADAVRAEHGAEHDSVRVLLGPAHAARRDVTEAYTDWVTVSQRPGARIAVLLGLAPGPGSEFSRYAEGRARR